MSLEFLKDYKPEKPKDGGFEPIKGNFNCSVDYARIEDYEGANPEFKGQRRFRYALTILENQEYAGRKFFKSVFLENEDKMKKLANQFFGLGLEFSSEEELVKCAEKLVLMQIKANAWTWKPDDGDAIQLHSLKGEVKEEEGGTTGAPAF